MEKCEERGAYKMTYQDDAAPPRRIHYATHDPLDSHALLGADANSAIDREPGHVHRHEIQSTRLERRLDDLPFVSPMAFQSTFTPGFIPFETPLMSEYNAPHCSSFQSSSIMPHLSSTHSSALAASAAAQSQNYTGGEPSARSLPVLFSFTSHQHAAHANEYIYPPIHAVYGGTLDTESTDSMSEPGGPWSQARAPGRGSDAFIPFPGTNFQIGDRFLQLLETKMGLDQQSATSFDPPAASSSAMPPLYPQSELALGRSTVAANDVGPSGPAGLLPRCSGPMSTHTPANSVPLQSVDQCAVEAALHDYTRTKIPPDLVAPLVPPCFGSSYFYPALWDNHRRSYQPQLEAEGGQPATSTIVTSLDPFGASAAVQPNPTVAHRAPMSYDLPGPYPPMQTSHISPHPTMSQHDPTFRPGHQISDVSNTLDYSFNGPPGSESRIAALSVPHAPAHWSATADRSVQHRQIPAESPGVLTVAEGNIMASTRPTRPDEGAELQLSPQTLLVGRAQPPSQPTSTHRAPVSVKTRLSALSPVVKARGVDGHGTTLRASTHPGMQIGSSSALQSSGGQPFSYSSTHFIQRDLSSPRSLPTGWTSEQVSSAAPSPRPASLTASPRPNTASTLPISSPLAKKRKLPRSESDPCAEDRLTRGTDLPPDNAISTASDPETTKAEEKKPVIACHLCRSKKLKCDGARPRCSTCVRKGEEACEYDKVLRRRGPGKHNKKDKGKVRGAHADEGTSDGRGVASAASPPGPGRWMREAERGGWEGLAEDTHGASGMSAQMGQEGYRVSDALAASGSRFETSTTRREGMWQQERER